MQPYTVVVARPYYASDLPGTATLYVCANSSEGAETMGRLRLWQEDFPNADQGDPEDYIPVAIFDGVHLDRKVW
jgi:hypothetical protein